jgi:hypothetical protein
MPKLHIAKLIPNKHFCLDVFLERQDTDNVSCSRD